MYNICAEEVGTLSGLYYSAHTGPILTIICINNRWNTDYSPWYAALLVLGHGESEHAVITRVPRALLDHQVLGVNVEAVAGLDGDHDHEEEADPLHDEDTEDDHSLITITGA